jgi:hypothetical protein
MAGKSETIRFSRCISVFPHLGGAGVVVVVDVVVVVVVVVRVLIRVLPVQISKSLRTGLKTDK